MVERKIEATKKDGRFICTVQKVVRLHCLPVVYMRSTWWSPAGDN